MFGTITRMLLEANGARPQPARRAASTEEIVWSRAAGGFITRPRPQRVTRWSDRLQAFETIDAYWDESTQAFVPAEPVDATCTADGISGAVPGGRGWSAADEAREFAKENTKIEP